MTVSFTAAVADGEGGAKVVDLTFADGTSQTLTFGPVEAYRLGLALCQAPPRAALPPDAKRVTVCAPTRRRDRDDKTDGGAATNAARPTTQEWVDLARREAAANETLRQGAG